MSEQAYDDDMCRRFGAIFPGSALDQQITNTRYLLDRGMGGDLDTLAMMLRAKTLRELDAIRDDEEPTP